MTVGELVTLLEAYADPEDHVVFRGGGGTYTNVALSHNDGQWPLGVLTIVQRDVVGVEGSFVSMLRDGSPGPVRLADRSKARDGL